MITERIKALFQFIDFLHSNIENFKQFNNLINDLYLLDKNRNELNPRNNFVEKIKYDEIQAEIKLKFEIIDVNIIQRIKTKAIELNICEWGCDKTLWNWNISEISNLKENFSNDNIPEILLHKSKYLEFRTKTNCDYFQTFFFNDLDEILKALFDYFKESPENEFEAVETKTIPVNNLREAVEQFKKGNKKISLPIDFLSNDTSQENKDALPRNKIIDTINDIKFVLVEQERKELPLRQEVEKHLQKLNSTEEKLKYLNQQKEIYLFNQSLEDFAASGVTAKYFPDKTELYFDKYITKKIKEIEAKEILLTQEIGIENTQLDFIEKHLLPYKQQFYNDPEYKKAIASINSFFQNETVIIKEPFFVKSGNIRKIGFAMGEIWRSKKNDVITYEYLEFCKKMFSIFKTQKLDKTNVFSNNLYKYLISKT